MTWEAIVLLAQCAVVGLILFLVIAVVVGLLQPGPPHGPDQGPPPPDA